MFENSFKNKKEKNLNLTTILIIGFIIFLFIAKKIGILILSLTIICGLLIWGVI